MESVAELMAYTWKIFQANVSSGKVSQSQYPLLGKFSFSSVHQLPWLTRNVVLNCEDLVCKKTRRKEMESMAESQCPEGISHYGLDLIEKWLLVWLLEEHTRTKLDLDSISNG